MVPEVFFLAASRLAFAASPLNSVAPNERKNLWHSGYDVVSDCFIYGAFGRNVRDCTLISLVIAYNCDLRLVMIIQSK